MKVNLFTSLGNGRSILQFEPKRTELESKQEEPVIKETNVAGYEDFSRFVLLGYTPTASGAKWSRVVDVQIRPDEVSEWEGTQEQAITFNPNTIQRNRAA